MAPRRPPDIQDTASALARRADLAPPSHTPQPTRSTSASLPAWLKALSGDELIAEANRSVESQIAAKQSPVKLSREQAAALAVARQQQISGVGSALQGMLGGLGGDLGGIYNKASDEIKGLGTSMGNFAAQNVAGGLAATDAYTAEMAPGSTDTGQAPNAGNLGEVLGAIGGGIPAEMLHGVGKASSEWGNAQPGVAAANTEMASMEARFLADQEDQRYVQELLQIARDRPELKMKVLDQLYGYEMDKYKLRLQTESDAAAARSKAAETAWDHKMDLRDIGLKERAEKRLGQALGLDADKQTWDQVMDQRNLAYKYTKDRNAANMAIQKAARENRQPDAALSAKYNYIVDSDGNAILNAQGKKIPVYNKPGAGRKTDTPAYQYGQARKEAMTLRGSPIEYTGDNPLVKGKYQAAPGTSGNYSVKDPVTKKYIRTTDNPKKAAHDSEYTFAEAQQYLMDRYPNLTKAQARKALVASGWKPNGVRPKPKPAPAPTGFWNSP